MQFTRDHDSNRTRPTDQSSLSLIDRRSFLRLAASSAATVICTPRRAAAAHRGSSAAYFLVHPFIEQNPSAVFIMRTSVDAKTNGTAIHSAGGDFARSVFLQSDVEGIPTNSLVAIKPNLTSRDRSHPQYTVERSMGIVTDAYFVEGIIDHLKTLGIAGSDMFIREINTPGDFADGGYIAMAGRTGVEIRDMYHSSVDAMTPSDVQWIDIPDGRWFKRIAYLWPVNAPGTYLLNIAKFKAHTMGITGCAKNLQGTNVNGYQRHCTAIDSAMNVHGSDICAGADDAIRANYARRVADGVPRWDSPGLLGGIRQEIWATRCLDNTSATKPGLHIMEGIYGRDGNFMNGPDPDGLATDYMTNIIIFGKNPYHNDIIAHWLAGHEPGNFGLFHMAVERGQAETINPNALDVYEWYADGTAVQRTLGDLERTPLKTVYLRRDYDGQTEDLYHMVDEHYDYGAVSVAERPRLRPDVTVLDQGYPNPFNSRVSIRYTVAHDSHIRLDVFDISGQRVAILADGFVSRGTHLAAWDAGGASSGVYLYRLQTEGASFVRSIVLMK